MDSERLKTLIRENANELVRLHARIGIAAMVLSSEHSGKQRAMNFMLDIAVSLSPEATKARLNAYPLANP
jgi:hypothetical protein